MITEHRMTTPAHTIDEISLERKLLKHVRDNVHGNIFLEPFLSEILMNYDNISSYEKNLEFEPFTSMSGNRVPEGRQSLTYTVYPGAVHSRFEHSLGVYWLAGKAVDIIKKYQGTELGIEHFDVQTVKLAGLLHDVGHGPFSHMFERGFLPLVLNGSTWIHPILIISVKACRSHEEMSVKMIDYIVDEHNIEMDPEVIKKVKEMITASPEYPSQRENQFLYDIVANGRNGIDVDKFDYIERDNRACGLGCNFQPDSLMESMQVVGDEICYRAKDYLTIHKLFTTRADLHRTVYTHAKVKAIELMVIDALVKANPYLGLASSIHQPSEFWKVDDSIIKTIETSSRKELKESRDLILRIRRRDIYQFCNEFSVPKEELQYFKDITPQDIVCSQEANGITLKEDDVVVSNVKIDLTRGRQNPLESVLKNLLNQDYDNNQEKFSISDHCISHLLPAFYEDMIVRVYSKKPELVGIVSAAFENLQLKKFGRKAQVHDTPEKKKRRR
ncbi:deoxynucleoside triphosphate triphosphohydrolase SAMHD1-like protein [Senna tora]|uniref:Deoxynucleoside triphosphate triphosphohydrolase SAMHD1-like protein n=1 Tax=Senna tora TaxID=362788 RepID=A0A834W4E7_9FABA|nr:deoxynucleoside triphosphate triphosphohydrolase SAMHD1-like protein [Senna tora]